MKSIQSGSIKAVDRTKASPRLQNFLEYLSTKRPCDDFTSRVDSAVYAAKTNSSWRKQYMTVGLWIEEAKEQAIKEGLAEGLTKGHAKGLAEGRAEGRAKGLAEGRADAKLEAAVIAVKNYHQPIEIVAADFNVPVEKLKSRLK